MATDRHQSHHVVEITAETRLGRLRRAYVELARQIERDAGPGHERHQALNLLERSRTWAEAAIGLGHARRAAPWRPTSRIDRFMTWLLHR